MSGNIIAPIIVYDIETPYDPFFSHFEIQCSDDTNFDEASSNLVVKTAKGVRDGSVIKSARTTFRHTISGQIYYFRARVVNSFGQASEWSVDSVHTAQRYSSEQAGNITSPSEITAGDIIITKTAGGVGIEIDYSQYNAPSDVERYELLIKKTSTSWQVSDKPTVITTSRYVNFVGDPGDLYYIFIRAVDRSGNYSTNYETYKKTYTIPGMDAGDLNNDNGWDGNVSGFYQTSPPTSGMKFGDIWIDTDGSWVGSELDDSYDYSCDPFASQPIQFYRSAVAVSDQNKTHLIWVSGSSVSKEDGNSYPNMQNNYLIEFNHDTNSWSDPQTLINYSKNPIFNDFTIDHSRIGVGGDTIYTSNFSGGTDGWYPYQGKRVGNVDGIGGEDDCLEYKPSISTNIHQVRKSYTGCSNGDIISLTFRVYIPSSNSDLDGIKIEGFDKHIAGDFETSVLDTWTTMTVIGRRSVTTIRIAATVNGALNFAGNNSDVFYIKDVSYKKAGLIEHYLFDDTYHSDILEDLTGNQANLDDSEFTDYDTSLTAGSGVYKGGNFLVFDRTLNNYFESDSDFVAGDKDFTILASFKTDTVDTDLGICGKMGGSSGYYYIRIHNNNKLMFRFSDGSSTIDLYSTTSVTDDNRHSVGVRRSGKYIALYVDGVLEDDVTTTSLMSAVPTDYFQIGNIGNSGSSYAFDGAIEEVAVINYDIGEQGCKEHTQLGNGWEWDGLGTISNDSFSQILTGTGEISQYVDGLDSGTEYRYVENNSETIITGVTNYTIELSSGTYTKSVLRSIYPVVLGPEKIGDDNHHAASIEVTNDGHFLVAYDPLSSDGANHNYGAFIKRSNNAHDNRLFTDVGFIQKDGTNMGGAYPQFARSDGDNVFIFTMGEGDGQPQNKIRMARSTNNGQTWTNGYDLFQGVADTTYWDYFRVLSYRLGGWIRIGVMNQWHSNGHIRALYILKTKDGITWYNEQETFSKNVVSSGFITASESNNFLMEESANVMQYTYTIESADVTPDDKLFVMVWRYDYDHSIRRMMLFWVDDAGVWVRDFMDKNIDNPTRGSLVCNDDGTFDVVMVSKLGKLCALYHSEDRYNHWNLKKVIEDFTDQNYSFSYTTDSLRKHDYNNWNIFLSVNQLESDGSSKGYRNVKMVVFDKTKQPTVYDIYRYEDENGNDVGNLAWRQEKDSAIGKNYLDAYYADNRAATKTIVFKQGSNTAIPIALSAGDIWYDSDNKNKPYRAAVAGASDIATGGWEEVRDGIIPNDESGMIKLIANPTTTGLYIDSSKIGYYNSSEGWMTYMSNNGDLYLSGTIATVPYTKLTSDFNVDDTTINVESTAGFPDSGTFAMRHMESFTYTGKTETSFTGVSTGGAYSYSTGHELISVDNGGVILTDNKTEIASSDYIVTATMGLGGTHPYIRFQEESTTLFEILHSGTNEVSINMPHGTITGGIIQTSKNGQRVVLSHSDNSLKFYNSSDVLLYHLHNDGSKLYIEGNVGTFNIDGISPLPAMQYSGHVNAGSGTNGTVSLMTLTLDQTGADRAAGINSAVLRLISSANGVFALYAEGGIKIGSGGLLFNSGSTVTEFSTDGTLSSNSDSKVPTEKAVKTYVDNNSGGSGTIYEDIGIVIDGGGGVITTGVKGDKIVSYNCTIEEITILGDRTGSIQIDIWKDTYANFPPTDGDSITGLETPSVSSDTKSQATPGEDWDDASINAGDILRFNVNSCSDFHRVILNLKVKRT